MPMPMAYTRRGSGAPLVLIHPLGGDRHMWAPVLDLLAAQRDVIAVDLPGFGESAPLPPGRNPSPPELAGAVGELLDELSLDRVHVAGNSLGGWVALELAALGRARTVTALSPAGLWPQPLAPRRSIARRLARGLLPVLPALVRTRRGRTLLLSASVARPAAVPPAAAAGLVRAYAQSPGFAQTNALMRASRFTGLERLSMPVTLAWAELDRLVGPPSWTPPRVRNLTLRGCGHIPTWDDPEQVTRVLLNGSATPGAEFASPVQAQTL